MMQAQLRLHPMVFVGAIVSASVVSMGLSVGLSLSAHTFIWQTLLVPALFMLLYGLLYQQIRIDERGILLRFTPFISRSYAWPQILRVDVVRIDPLSDFGGWGLKYSRRLQAWGYVLRGEDALRITLTDGKQIYATVPDTAAAQQAVHVHQPLLT